MIKIVATIGVNERELDVKMALAALAEHVKAKSSSTYKKKFSVNGHTINNIFTVKLRGSNLEIY